MSKNTQDPVILTVELQKRYVCPNCDSGRLNWDGMTAQFVNCLMCGFTGALMSGSQYQEDDDAPVVVRYTDMPGAPKPPPVPPYHPSMAIKKVDQSTYDRKPDDDTGFNRMALKPDPKAAIVPRSVSVANPNRARTAEDFLRDAADTLAQRAKQYDKPQGERSMRAAMAAFNMLTGYNLSESHGWCLLGLVKQARQLGGDKYHADSALDAVAYFALMAEALENEANPF